MNFKKRIKQRYDETVMPISRELFKTVIAEIEKCSNYYDDLYEINHKYDIDNFLCYPDCMYACIGLLQETLKSDMISYWIYEEDFGKSYQDGDIIDEDDFIIPMKTVDDLYDYLVDNYINREATYE